MAISVTPVLYGKSPVSLRSDPVKKRMWGAHTHTSNYYTAENTFSHVDEVKDGSL